MTTSCTLPDRYEGLLHGWQATVTCPTTASYPRVKVHHSALKHGVLPENAIQAADWSLWIEPLDDEDSPHREPRLGFDTRARLLEAVVLTFESGEEMVIHAMPARKQYWDLLP